MIRISTVTSSCRSMSVDITMTPMYQISKFS